MPERCDSRKKLLAERARGACEYCRSQARFAMQSFSYILGYTPTGRATVEALRLNREGLINLRRVLYTAGEHPPAEPEEALQ